MSTKNAPKVTAAPVPAAAAEIPDAGAFQLADPEELEGLTIGPPFAMTSDCELVDRGGDDCGDCGQPEVSGSVSIVQCECGQVFRINLLSSGVKPCPAQCGRVFTHLLLVTTQDDDQVFADASMQVLRANGYTVQAPGDDEPEPDDDDDDEPTDPEQPSEDDDEPEPGDDE
jgi:hypothetical protein